MTAIPTLQTVWKDRKRARKYLRDLIGTVEKAIIAIDTTMGDSQDERAKQIARIVNSLEIAKDIAKRYGL